jgi:hypothetical protein
LPAESASTELSTEPAATTVREPDPSPLSADSAYTLHTAYSASTVYAAKSTAALLPGESAATRLHSRESDTTVLPDSGLAELPGESELHSTANDGYSDVHARSPNHPGGHGSSSSRRTSSGRSRCCRAGVHIHADHVSNKYPDDDSHAANVHTADAYADDYSHAVHASDAVYTTDAIHAIHAVHAVHTVYSAYRIGTHDSGRRRRRRIWRLLA